MADGMTPRLSLKFDPLPDDELRALATRNPHGYCEFEYVPESKLGSLWTCVYCGTINWTPEQVSRSQHCVGISKQYADAVIRLLAENAEWKASFELYDSAMRRGTELWHLHTGKTGVWPDAAVLVAWLIARYDGANAILDILLREYHVGREDCPVCGWMGGHAAECIVKEYDRMTQGFCECGYMALPPVCTHCSHPFPPPPKTETPDDMTRRLAEAEKPCIWTPQTDGNGDYWDTACGHAICFDVDGPVENEYDYCPGCGHPLMLVPPIEEVDVEDCSALAPGEPKEGNNGPSDSR